MQSGDSAVVAADDLNRLPAGGGKRRRNAGCEHEAVHAVLQILDDLLSAGDVTAAGPKRLGERSVLDVDIIRIKVEIIVTSSGIAAYNASGVGFVHHEEALILLLEPDIVRDWCDITIHAVNALDNDEHFVVPATDLLQDALKLDKVIVVEDLSVRLR